MRFRPAIGITSSARDEHARYRVNAKYVDAVRRAGAMAFLLPPGEKRPEDAFAFLDAIVMSGGGDVDPRLYDGEAHPMIYGVDKERDQTELRLARAIVAAKKPALCICRGMQVLNVAFGGSLVEHVPDETSGDVTHLGEDDYALHPIELERTSELARIFGTTSLNVASWHHQAVRDVAKGFRAVAVAADGTIEAIETPEHPALIAVQWHPEHTAEEDALQQRLFDALVASIRPA
jgi:putative glutamine amidotransferase